MLIVPLLLPVSAKRGNVHRLLYPQNGSGKNLPVFLETRSFWEMMFSVMSNRVFGCLDRGSAGNRTGPELLCSDGEANYMWYAGVACILDHYL